MLPTRYGHTDFYSVAAQVIPVLLLAIVFEQRMFRRRDIPLVLTASLGPVITGAFVVAEAVSLRVLYRGYAHRQDQILVIAPLLIGALLLLTPIVVPPLLALERSDRHWQSRFAKLLTLGMAIFVIGVLVALFKQ